MDEFEKLKQEAADANTPVIEIDSTEKERIWKAKRSKCYITSSTLPALVKGGRNKGVLWGDTAKNILHECLYEIQNGVQLEPKDFWQMKWGRENEPKAIEWLRGYTDLKVKSCAEDFEEIIFNEPFPLFGDSPDAYVYNENGSIHAVVEIKCPTSQLKIQKLRKLKLIHDKHEHYHQFLGHLIGEPKAPELWWLNYDAYVNKGYVSKMKRVEHLGQIKQLTARINDGIYVIGKCLEDDERYDIEDIETILNER